ncbi:hypothetical protein E4U34_007233 [Claviceps purpurea]|nr:hypothetical protein E4U51_004318 [Claviceps purpurea]KAG6211526.1 hypothetical protein E4U34_007233 [Claviceps purpurea]KAG6256253.1 hypothetical protein E4U23_002568 [Claviceps purpurea]KAG6264661.1 hypothetical protein E4U48_006207 [Claviceps purpurea]KAG6268870.1 hypothetical protein E4U47_004401 [Claviceps purpurea]
MDTSKLVPHDPRVREETAEIRGKTYSYIIGEPKNQQPIDTVFLIHGWPDLNFGWRSQIPFLMSLGFRVVAPSMVGYAGTSRPEDLKQWSFKSVAADIRALATKFVGEDGQIILGGHDWGGAVVWRVALWHPKLIKAVFSVCTPFHAPNPNWVSLEDHLAAGRLENFRYQLQLAGPDVEEGLQTEQRIHQFLNGMFGGRGPNGEYGFTTSGGAQFDNLALLGPSPLLSREEVDYYAAQYMLQPSPPMRGPLNWYRTRRINYEEEVELAGSFTQVEPPALFIAATKDAALPPAMSSGMEKYFKDLTRGEVEATHWALVEATEQVNNQIVEWLVKVLPDGTIKAAL